MAYATPSAEILDQCSGGTLLFWMQDSIAARWGISVSLVSAIVTARASRSPRLDDLCRQADAARDGRRYG